MANKQQNVLNVDWSRLDKALQEMRSADSRPGPEWFTVAEYMQQPGVNVKQSQAKRRLRDLLDAGVVEKRLVSGTGYYRIND